MAITGIPSDICLPTLGFCTPDGGDPTRNPDGNPNFIDCEDKWNNNLCKGDKCFFMPYVAEDPINIFAAGILGIVSVDVVQLDGTALPVPATVLISTGANGSYITVTVPDGNPCFTIKVTDPRGTYCQQMDYKFVNCEGTIRIRGMYNDGETDCFNAVYPFDNTIRLEGYLVRGKGDQIEKTEFGDSYSKRELESRYTLILTELVPPYVHDILAKQILLGNTIRIETEPDKWYELKTENSFELASDDIKSQMFYYGKRLVFKMICEVISSCE